MAKATLLSAALVAALAFSVSGAIADGPGRSYSGGHERFSDEWRAWKREQERERKGIPSGEQEPIREQSEG